MGEVVAWVSAAIAVVAVCGLAVLWARGRDEIAVRVAQEIKEHADGFDQAVINARTDLKHLAEQIEELLDDARAQRAKLNGRKGGRPSKEPEGPRYRSLSEYKNALERGAPRDPETERALGWQ